MSVLVDTSVWSLAFRRDVRSLSYAQGRVRSELAELIRAGHVRLIGPVRQELLSGISREAVFGQIRNELRAFSDVPLETADYEEAARISTFAGALESQVRKLIS